MLRASILLVAALGVGFACGSSTGPGEGQVSVTTDRSSYSIHSHDIVYAQVTNRGPDSVYMAVASYSVVVQKQFGLIWLDLPPWYLLAGGVWFAYPLPVGEAVDAIPFSAAGVGPGRYRFVWTLYSDNAMQHLLPLSMRASNVFQIVE